MEAPKKSLLDLEPELLLLTIDFLPLDAVKALRLTNSAFSKLARAGLHRKVKLHYQESANEDFEEPYTRLQTEGLLHAVRLLDIKSFPFKRLPGDGLDNFDRMDRFIKRCVENMIGLTDVRWQGSSIPPDVIAALGSRPRVRLSWRPMGIESPDQLLDLKGSLNLHLLDVGHTYTTTDECLLVTQPLRQLLLTCPNVRKLKLDITRPKGGCVAYGLPFTCYGMGFCDGERPPALEELEIVEYPFCPNGSKPGTVFDNFDDFYNYKGYPGDRSEGEYWAETFDWSRLRKLRTSVFGLATRLLPTLEQATRGSPLLPALEELTLDQFYGDIDGKPISIESPPTLKSLEIERIGRLSSEGLLRAGLSLQKLRIHQPEHRKEGWNETAIQESTLLKFREHCPNIKELALDLAREDEWPYSTLDLLSSFPRLQRLEVWFELGIRQPESPLKPYVTFAAVAKLFRYLHERNTSVRELIIHSGGPCPGLRFDFGPPLWGSSWPNNNHATFECKLAVMEDEARHGIFKTSCMELSEEENAMLQEVMARYPDGDVLLEAASEGWNKLDAKRLKAYRVAWEGPVPLGHARFAREIEEAKSLPLPDEEDEALIVEQIMLRYDMVDSRTV